MICRMIFMYWLLMTVPRTALPILFVNFNLFSTTLFFWKKGKENWASALLIFMDLNGELKEDMVTSLKWMQISLTILLIFRVYTMPAKTEMLMWPLVQGM